MIILGRFWTSEGPKKGIYHEFNEDGIPQDILRLAMKVQLPRLG